MLPDVFPDRARSIFVFRDGTGERRADPLAIEERLFRALSDLDHEAMDQHLKSPEIRVAFDALAKLLPAVREAFGVAAFEDDPEKGLTREESLDLLARFWDWRDGLKKSGGPTASTSPPTADGPAPGPTTRPSSASGGTGSASRRSKRSRRSGARSPR